VASAPRRDRKNQTSFEIMDEIVAGQINQKGKKNEDLLLNWIRQPHIKKALLPDEMVNSDFVALVTESCVGDRKWLRT
jgi:hypothetical protein